MQQMPKTRPISDIKNRPGDVMELIGQGPIMLTSRGNAAAVLISIDEWNAIAEQLEERQFTKAHMDALAMAYKRMSEPREWVDGEELKAMMAERYGHVADKV